MVYQGRGTYCHNAAKTDDITSIPKIHVVEGKDFTSVSCSLTSTQFLSHEINKLKCNKNLKRLPKDHPKLITSCSNILWGNHCSGHHPFLLVSL